MWLSEQRKKRPARSAGEIGDVTLAEDTLAVELESERRGMEVYAPGGYRWRPAVGQQVLVLKAEGEPKVVGVPVDGAGLAPGETALENGGAWIRLGADGGIRLGPQVQVEGSLYIDGQELSQWVRKLVAQLL